MAASSDAALVNATPSIVPLKLLAGNSSNAQPYHRLSPVSPSFTALYEILALFNALPVRSVPSDFISSKKRKETNDNRRHVSGFGLRLPARAGTNRFTQNRAIHLESSVAKVADIHDLPGESPQYLPSAQIVRIERVQKVRVNAFRVARV